MLESWEVPGFEVLDETPQVFLVSRAQKLDCPQLGSVCGFPGGQRNHRWQEVSEDRPDGDGLARGTQCGEGKPGHGGS